MSLMVEGSHAAEAFSKVGRTREVYAVFFTRLVYSLKLRLKKPSVLMPLPLSRLYGYARIGRCSDSRPDTSHCQLPPVCVCKLTASQSVC